MTGNIDGVKQSAFVALKKKKTLDGTQFLWTVVIAKIPDKLLIFQYFHIILTFSKACAILNNALSHMYTWIPEEGDTM